MTVEDRVRAVVAANSPSAADADMVLDMLGFAPAAEPKAGQGRPRRPKHQPPKSLHPCGTPAAFHRHKRAGEDPCEACKAALKRKSAEYAKARAALTRAARPPRALVPCGTPGALRRHQKAGEVCETCREASRSRARDAARTRSR